MPRRRPGALRASQWRPARRTLRRIRGLSPRTTALIHHLEGRHPDLHLGTEVALRLYRWFLAQPGRHLYLERTACPCPGGHFDDTASARDAIEEILRLLPPRPRRELAAIVRPLDEELRRRTLPDPGAPPGPWWRRLLYHDHTPEGASREYPDSGPHAMLYRRDRKSTKGGRGSRSARPGGVPGRRGTGARGAR